MKCHRLIQSHASALESYSMGIMIRTAHFFELFFIKSTIIFNMKNFIVKNKILIFFFSHKIKSLTFK